MNILVIDTCFAACIVGVMRSDQSTFSNVVQMERGQSESLIPMVMDVVAKAGLVLGDIQLIAVNVGPGSFTGVRVGIAAARGLALGIGCSVQGVLSTDAIYIARGNGVPARVAIDTRRNDYFVADYQSCADVPMAPASVRISDRFDDTGVPVFVDADIVTSPGDYVAHVARLAAHLYVDGSTDTKGQANPIYIREAEVSTPKRP